MIFYDLMKTYYYLTEQRALIYTALKQETYYNIRQTKTPSGTYYYSISFVKSKPHRTSISKSEYTRRLSENIRFRRIRKALDEIEVLIRFFEKRIDKYRHTLDWEYQNLSYAASLSEPNDTSFYAEQNRIYKTKRGDMVRSKSEQAIANALYDNGIDYEYESVNWSREYLPDFIIFDSIRGRTVIWEHFGLMGDPKYVVKTLRKLRYYESIGYTLGDNLIATFELYEPADGEERDPTDPLVLDSARAEEIVRRNFTPYVFPCTA